MQVDLDELQKALQPIPTHMHKAVIEWVTKAEPHPDSMGSFFGSMLRNDFARAVTAADTSNARCLREWALFFYNDVPSPCWGSYEKLLAWYTEHHQDTGR